MQKKNFMCVSLLQCARKAAIRNYEIFLSTNKFRIKQLSSSGGGGGGFSLEIQVSRHAKTFYCVDSLNILAP
jgi:hypothetical protein